MHPRSSALVSRLAGESNYDYIIAGGGTAGCVLAARLSQDPAIRVLLVEAGSAQPLPMMSNPLAWIGLWRSSVDWNYITLPQRATDGAEHHWPRGKVLGGSSGINGMMHVRGDRSSYDAWENAGATGWNYTALLPFFKRSERAPGRDPAYRGVDGAMVVSPGRAGNPLWEACFQAAVETGFPPNGDSNAATSEGTAWVDVNIVDGVRQSASDAYLTPEVRKRSNLTIITDALVQRLLIDGTTCHGVEYSKGGQIQSSLAEREVVLSAGVIGTPQLLLLSGIGPGDHLRDLGIRVIVDLPGVGANLHDHPKAQVAYAAQGSVRSNVYARKPLVLFRSEPSVAPDLQIIFADIPIHPRFTAGPEDGYSVIFSLMTPRSRGSVRLASANPVHAPLIDPNYLAEDADMERMLAGLRNACEIGGASALAQFRRAELFPGRDAQTEASLRAYVRRCLNTYYHPVGTCKIGNDAMSVVNPQLRVRGVSNLRIVDASVMPSITSGNTNAAVLAIAERAASLLSGELLGGAIREGPAPVQA